MYKDQREQGGEGFKLKYDQMCSLNMKNKRKHICLSPVNKIKIKTVSK